MLHVINHAKNMILQEGFNPLRLQTGLRKAPKFGFKSI
jgi:hypothetical protein